MLIIYFLVVFLVGLSVGMLIINHAKHSEITRFISEREHLMRQLEYKNNELNQIGLELVTYKRDNYNQVSRIEEQKIQLNELKKQFNQEFENLANRIFDEKVHRFTQQNHSSMSNLLNPLNDKIKSFETKVHQVYDIEGKERASLKEQIQQLTKLNQVMNEETKNLTKALKGESKIQGNWGEMILESILEKSGLVKDREYFVQQLHTVSDGKRFRPDVIINLPQNKVIIVDSKVSLTAYEKFVSSEDEISKDLALKDHVRSIKTHIKGLSEKSYQSLYQTTGLDFVLMFVPIESALTVALDNDLNLFDDVLKYNIVLVSPTTLIAILRTIASIWRTEHSMENAQQIATLGGDIYDRLCKFLDSMGNIDVALKKATKNYKDAIKELQGDEGIIESALQLKELGGTTTKVINPKWIG